ncbi:hypothetical protein BX661DRAFT_184607 [Kickxella alabastrina]|uniref:uncharacterized protein n=1 Tax=Kickxella alabastrina TaxID=61397 RepID=UPI002220CE23|nr:uncharacterized protein BX661DRAFT_184607 [Kickxella alabastrina]KAI7825454.1 hypothetical protein BX661DRAFT_184607 [Kickxella alabastrina]
MSQRPLNRDSDPKRVRFAPGSSSRPQQTPKANVSFYGNDIPVSALNDEYSEYSDDNDALEADITSSRRRARRVNMDGYNSDASDQDEVGNQSDLSDEADELGENPTREDLNNEIESNDEDMFVDSSGAVPEGESSLAAKKKRKRFLDIADIEGQEMSSTSRVEDGFGSSGDRKGKRAEGGDSEDDEGEGKVRIEAFNMKDDLEEGQFDANGNFVWNKKDPQTYQDSWLDGISKTAIERARESKAKQDREPPQNNYSNSGSSTAVPWDTVSNDDISLAIINLLQPRETVLNALARIGGPKKKVKNKWSKKAKAKAKAATDEDGGDGEQERERRGAIEQLTELADRAMARGLVNIYDETYEQLVRQMRMANRIGDDWEVGTFLPTLAMPLTPATAYAPSGAGDGGEAGGLLDDLDDLI